MTGNPEIAALPLAALAEAIDSEDPTPGGGAVAACAAALASALAGMAARFSARDAAGSQLSTVVDRAALLRVRCLRLADEDAAAYARYAAAARMPKQPDPRARQQAVRSALDGAAAVPLELAETAAELTRLAEQLARDGNTHLRSDAATAALLGAAAARGAAIFVADNLRGASEDPRLIRARAAASDAQAAARRCVAIVDGALGRPEVSRS